MKPSITQPPVALSIAGSDNVAGAGIQADLKTMGTYGVYGVCAVTCLVAETPGCVSRVEVMPPDFVGEQIRLNFASFPISVVKTGMLFSAEIIMEVCEQLKALAKRPWLVVDPVMVSTAGDTLLKPEAIRAYREVLFPMADIITPNLDEACILAEMAIANFSDLEVAGKKLQKKYGSAFLMKGVHLKTPEAVDILVTRKKTRLFSDNYLSGFNSHGSGCTFSAAITSALALGMDLEEAVASAKKFITRAVSQHYSWRVGDKQTTALNHFTRIDVH